jgi:L-2-hydroxyglutarate oxidase LhgO
MEVVDCVVVGAGVVGLAVARALALRGQEVVVLDQGSVIGQETSSRNSEVIHAGIYYPAGSLKARLCVEGRRRLYDYCAARGLLHRRTGKIIVATTAAEVRILEDYRAKALANGVDDLAWLTAGQVAGLEPAVRCVSALASPSTGIVSSHEYMLALQGDIEAARGTVVLNTRVARVGREGALFAVDTGEGQPLGARRLVNAAGLHAPALAGRIEGLPPQHVPRAWFAKGHYYAYQGRSPFSRLVYPVAEKGGLGIHVTLDTAGAARFGPDVTWIDAVDYAFDDSRRGRFAASIRRYFPALDEARLQPAYTGIRPKISGPEEPAADFLLQGPAVHGVPGLLNLYGIESPGLTASLALAERAADLLA